MGTFKPVSKYGLSILVTSDPELQEYLREVLHQLTGWMLQSQVKRFVVAITSQVTGETHERWGFDVEVNQETLSAVAVPRSQSDAVREQKEIQAIIRQITASVTFLPLLEGNCTFDLLVYTDKWAQVPNAWGESDPKHIKGESEEVRLRSFTTKIHTVEGAVVYKFNG